MTKKELDAYTLAVLKDGVPVANQRELMREFLGAAMAEPIGELKAHIAELESLLREARELLHDAAEPDAGKPGYLGAQWDVDALALITKIDAS